MMIHRKSSIELEYVILGMKFDIDFLDGAFTDEEQKDIREFVDHMSKEMFIDKSYVECKENKRKSTFMLEKGWNSLREVILDTKFCYYMSDQIEEVLLDAFVTMGRCYMYECLAMQTNRLSDINIAVKEDCEFEIIVCKDTSNDYKHYLGRWQDWEYDDNGNFLSSHAANEDEAPPEVNTDDE